MAPNKSLSTLEVAELLHVSKSTIYELIPATSILIRSGARCVLHRMTWTPISPDPAMSRASSR